MTTAKTHLPEKNLFMLLNALVYFAAILFCHNNYVLDITVDRSCIPAYKASAKQQTMITMQVQ